MDQPDASLDNWLDGIDLTSNAPDDANVLSEPVDLKALLLRRFTWDTVACSKVEGLLPKLGLTIGTPEGIEHEHTESHQRLAAVMPFEQMMRDYAMVLSTVLTTAIIDAHDIEMTPEGNLRFVQQNAELILSGGRAIVAQLFFMGLLGYGPLVEVHMAHITEDGTIVLDDETAPETGELPGQLSFGDLEHGSDLG